MPRRGQRAGAPGDARGSEPERAWAAARGPVVPRALHGWSRSAAPREACGLLLGAPSTEALGVRLALRLDNIAPQRDRFALPPLDVLRAHEVAERLGLAVVAVWHSHVWAAPVPSPADLAEAWPELAQVVVGPAASESCAVRAWRVASGRVLAVPLRVQVGTGAR